MRLKINEEIWCRDHRVFINRLMKLSEGHLSLVEEFTKERAKPVKPGQKYMKQPPKPGPEGMTSGDIGQHQGLVKESPLSRVKRRTDHRKGASS